MNPQKTMEIQLNAFSRIVLIGGPLRGKSTLAKRIRDQYGVPTFCGDAKSMVREPDAMTTYVPEGIGWSESSLYVAENWLSRPGPWCCEGVSMARALRKFININTNFAETLDDAIIIYIASACSTVTPKQESMAKGVESVWREIFTDFKRVVSIESVGDLNLKAVEVSS